ncbi:MAG: hypothetical protein R3B47_12895 [Bacteroidia bacterium]
MTFRSLLLFFLTGAIYLLPAQTFTTIEKLQGYAQRADTTWFIFDEALYQEAEKVVVTGSFRGWSQDMNDPAWLLKNDKLAIFNPEFKNIPPRAEFKFRINDGEWLSPPADAPNSKGGNLLYMQHIQPPGLHAEITPNSTIWAKLAGVERSLLPSAYRLSDAEGREIPIAEVLPNLDTEILIIAGEEIDKRKVYYLEIPSAGLKSWCNYDGWFRSLYSSKALGANVSANGKSTAIRLFAPRAESVWLYLYNDKNGPLDQKMPMEVDEHGVWEAYIAGDMSGSWYDFTVHGSEQPGNHFYETNPKHISDPYARVNDDAWGRSMITKATKAASPLANGIPKLEDVIAYEVHIQDFTDLLPVDKNEKGTIPAFHKSGLKNTLGQPIGFDYLVDLGINVVHLQPVQEFMHHPDDIWQQAFKDDPDMIAQDIHLETTMGYRTRMPSRWRTKSQRRCPGAEAGAAQDLQHRLFTTKTWP